MSVLIFQSSKHGEHCSICSLLRNQDMIVNLHVCDCLCQISLISSLRGFACCFFGDSGVENSRCFLNTAPRAGAASSQRADSQRYPGRASQPQRRSSSRAEPWPGSPRDQTQPSHTARAHHPHPVAVDYQTPAFIRQQSAVESC